jgi:RimJ/RimL family protein N-acetyltransferase
VDTHGPVDRARQRALVATGPSLKLLIGFDEYVARWVGARVQIEDFGACTAIGIVDDAENEVIAGVVYNNFREASIEATIASSTPRWCSKGILHSIFWYPFCQLGVSRLTAITEVTNQHAAYFLSRLGFQQEGVIRRGFRNGVDAIIYGMLREECRWLKNV